MSMLGEVVRDHSVLGLVRNADLVVQSIMAGLVLCSVVCWAIILEKLVRLRRLRNETRALQELAREPRGTNGFLTEPGAGLVRRLSDAAREELAHRVGPAVPEHVRSDVETALRAAMRSHLKSLEPGLPFLATIGSAAPFIGLFGTVWGIMHSFSAIAESKDTSLAVVAPGIAEALLATAIGLAAAIPAVIAYNQIVVSLGRSAEQIGTAVSALARKLSRTPAIAGRAAE